MTGKLVLTGATGKIGGSVLDAILDFNLFDPANLVIATSSAHSHPKFARAVALGAIVRSFDYNSVDILTEAFTGCERLFLVSSPRIELDFHDCAQGGRELHHFNALEAAKRAGLLHVYYTSLAFKSPSKAAVMRAHLQTEEYLRTQKGFDFTIIREGIYSESWPLYLGHFDCSDTERSSITIGSDGPICWTSIDDLGLANALILTGKCSAWAGRTLYLSAKEALKITDVLHFVCNALNRKIYLMIEAQQEYIRHYVEEKSMDNGMIEWWSSTYPALKDGECDIDCPLLEDLLASRQRKPKSMEQTVRNMCVNFQ